MIVLLPSFLISRDLCQLPWPLEPLKAANKAVCVMGMVKRHTCVFEIINIILKIYSKTNSNFFFNNLGRTKSDTIENWAKSNCITVIPPLLLPPPLVILCIVFMLFHLIHIMRLPKAVRASKQPQHKSHNITALTLSQLLLHWPQTKKESLNNNNKKRQ